MTDPLKHEFDLFISYAHADDADGTISQMVEAIQAEHARFTPQPLQVFFDRASIVSMSDWEHRILRGIRESKVMLALLSPAYFESVYCRKEWELYVEHELSQAMPGEAIAPIYIATYDAFESHAQDALNEWIRNLKRRQYLDVRNWWSGGLEALQREDVRRRLELLNQQIGERLHRLMRVQASPTSVPEHNPHFVGRLEELRALREKLALGKVGATVALTGLGGMGKSAVAFEYAHSYADDYPDGRFLIGCEGVSDLGEALLKLVPQLGIVLSEPEQRSLDLAVGRIRSVLASFRRVLLVLDNVDDPKLLAAQSRARCLPDGAKVHVLATTRLGGDRLPGVDCLPIDSLGERDAVRLLEKHRPFSAQDADDEWKAALRIVRLLGAHALAVEVVAVFLWQNPDVSYQDFLARLEEEGFAAVDAVGSDEVVQLSRHTQKMIGELVGSTLDKLADEEREIVLLSATLPPDGIPADWLKHAAGRKHPELAGPPKKGHPDPWKRLSRRLEGLRLLTPVDDGGKIWRMHRLVHGVVAERMAEEVAERRAQMRLFVQERGRSLAKNWVEQTARWELAPLVDCAGDWMARGDGSGVRLANSLAEPLHELGRFLEARSLLRRAIEFNSQASSADSEQLAVSCSNLGVIELTLGDEPAGRALLIRAVDVWKQAAVPNHALLARAYSNLASLDRAAGKHQTASDRLKLAIKLWKKMESPDYAALATGYSNLAVSERALGRFTTAKNFHQTAIGIREQLFPANHPVLAVSYANLAAVECELADFASARALLQRALAIRTAAFDEKHPLLAATYCHLAAVDLELSDLRSARDLYRRALVIREQAFDPDHPSLAATLTCLASVESDLAAFPAARENYERALSVQRRILSPRHPSLATSLASLASMENELGRYAAALELSREALAIREEAFRGDHPVLATSYEELGSLMRTLARFDEARKLFEQSRVIKAHAYPPDHPAQAGVLAAIGALEQELANYASARDCLERAYAIRVQAYGPDDPAVASSCAGLAALERELGHLARARELAERAHAIRAKSFEEGHPLRARSDAGLASVEQACGNLERALELQQRALAIRETVYDREHPQVASSCAALASIHLAQGDALAARPFSARALAIRCRLFEPAHPLIASSFAGLAAIERKDGRTTAARELLLQALEIHERAYGADHPAVARDASSLAFIEADAGNPETARRLMRRAWAIRLQRYGADHARTESCRAWLATHDPELRSE